MQAEKKPRKVQRTSKKNIINEPVVEDKTTHVNTQSVLDEDTNEKQIDNECDSQPTEQEQKVPKKRGRKPKGGKIIKQNIINENLENNKPNIILHLKCSLSDIKEKIFPLESCEYNPTISESLDGYTFNSSKESLTFDYVDYNVNPKKTTENIHVTLPKEPVVIQTTNENEQIKDIWKKISELEVALHNNDISDKKSACFWCTCDFDNPPIFIPKYELNNTYHAYGCFCSPECAAAFLMKENIDQASKIERYALLNHIYCKIYAYEKNIKPAPSPFYTLNKYYGNLTIQEYRKLLKNERLLLVVDKPLTRQLPELHQDNDDFIINNNSIPSASKYKLKRSNNKQTKTSILNETFGGK